MCVRCRWDIRGVYVRGPWAVHDAPMEFQLDVLGVSAGCPRGISGVSVVCPWGGVRGLSVGGVFGGVDVGRPWGFCASQVGRAWGVRGASVEVSIRCVWGFRVSVGCAWGFSGVSVG